MGMGEMKKVREVWWWTTASGIPAPPRNFMRFPGERSVMATVGRTAGKEVRIHSTCQGALRYSKAFIEKRMLVSL